MIKSGLLSVTFRPLQPEEIVRHVAEAGLDAIEWGGDIHVPHGDVAVAREIARLTEAAGLQVASYGSYYQVGCPEDNGPDFDSVLASAVALRAPAIRVWAGNRGSAATGEERRRQIVDDALRIAGLAEANGMTIDYEFHSHTLTDTLESTLRLLEETKHPNIRCNWQPDLAVPTSDRSAGLSRILPRLANLHVFHWAADGTRLALAEGRAEWDDYLRIAGKNDRPRFAMLEFVREGSPEHFREDAAVLRTLLDSVNN